MPLTSMPEVIRQIAGSADTYISQSAFLTGKRRTLSTFKHVNSCWVDLDYYNDLISPEEWSSIKLQRIVEHGKELGIPAPSMIVDSGQGAYVRWIFDAPVYQLPIWNRIQQTLTALYTALAADHKSKDASRVLRPIGTINTKNNTDVNVIQLTGIEYNFNEFVKQIESLKVDLIDPLIQSKVKSNKVHKSLVKLAQHIENAPRGDMVGLEVFSKLREPLMLNWCDQSLHWARFTDLRDIVIKRGGFKEGERDLMLFWMCNSLAQAGIVTPANWDTEVDSLLRCFPVGADFDPIKSGYLTSLKRRMLEEHAIYGKIRNSLKSDVGASESNNVVQKTREKLRQVVATGKGLYRPSNTHLIQAFGITNDEQESLKTLIGKEEKHSRRMQRIDRRNPERAANRAKRNEWQEYVKQIARDKTSLVTFDERTIPTACSLGINLTEISLRFDVDRTVVSKFLKKNVKELLGSKTIENCKQKLNCLDVMVEIEPAKVTADQSDGGKDSRNDIAIEKGNEEDLNSSGVNAKNSSWAAGKILNLVNEFSMCSLESEGEDVTLAKSGQRKLSVSEMVAQRIKEMGVQGQSKPSGSAVSKNAERQNSGKYHVPAPRRPFAKYTHPVPSDFSPVSAFGAETWKAAQEQDGNQFIVVEIMDRNGVRLQRFSETATHSSHDVYGEIIALTDPELRRAVLALRDCTIFVDSCKLRCRIPESLEDQPCLFEGEKYWLSRPMRHYLVGGLTQMSGPSRPDSIAMPEHAAAAWPLMNTPVEGEGGDEGVWIDDPTPY